MTTKYHISHQTGRPNKCYATKQPCPIGGENDHYATREEAQEAFEDIMKNAQLPESQTKEKQLAEDGHAQKQLRRLAMSAETSEDLDFPSRYGDDSAIWAIANNPHATGKQLARIEERATIQKNIDKIKDHPNYSESGGGEPVKESEIGDSDESQKNNDSSMFTKKQIAEYARNPHDYHKIEPLVRGDLSDAGVSYIGKAVDADSYLQEEILISPNKNLSIKTRRAALIRERNKRLSERAVNDRNLPLAGVYSELSKQQKLDLVKKSTRPEVLDYVANQELGSHRELRNAPHDPLFVMIYRNPNVSDETKKKLEEVPIVSKFKSRKIMKNLGR